MNLPEIPEEFIEQYNQLENNRKVMHIKHFSRDISHEAWFDFISNEVLDFIENILNLKNSKAIIKVEFLYIIIYITLIKLIKKWKHILLVFIKEFKGLIYNSI